MPDPIPLTPATGPNGPKKPVATPVAGAFPYLWIGDDAPGGGLFATVEGANLRKLYRAIGRLLKPAKGEQ